ncbi:MAG: SUMF1/EgtB/PvdO family nonheme iron enzyme [Candidatus Marinimicrobia bacterium]|nr:SUMF1/EgtB/PvdO family nonheme iron enzyme [Candidatus Neomarinimicrobiota bacterium]
MKTIQYLSLLLILIVLYHCEDRLWTNPHDAKNQLSPDQWSPDGLSLEQLNVFTAKLTWHQMEENVDGFRIDKRTADNAWTENFRTLDKTDAAEYSITDDGLTPDTTLVHEYRITTFAHEESSSSKTITITPVFPKPSDLQLEQLTLNQINLTWKDNSDGEEGFKIDRKIGAEDWQINYKTLGQNATSFLDTMAVPNKTNLYRVYAFYSSHNSAQIQSSQNIFFPSPTDFAAEQLSLARIKLTWKENILGEDGFTIDRKYESNDWQTGYAVVGKNITTYTDENALPAANFRYRITAYNKDQTSSSKEVAISTLFPAPSDLTGQLVSDKAVVLNWTDNSDDEEGFKVDRKVGNGEWVENYGSVIGNVTTWTDENPVYGQTNFYIVYAYFGEKKSGSLNTSVFSFMEAPTNLQSQFIDDEHISLTWEDNCPFESQYVIERNSGSGYSEIATVNANNTTFTDNTVSYATSYQYRVKASTQFNSSEYSNETKAITIKINAPYNLILEELDEYSLTLHWEDSCHFESGFKIERSDDGAAFVEIGSVGPDIHEYTETGLQNDFRYQYRVFAFTSKNQSNKTNIVEVLLPPAGLRYVEGGSFVMGDIWHEGDKDEQTLRNVNLPDFFMGTYEITHQQFIEFLNNSGADGQGKLNGNYLLDMNDMDCAIEWDNIEFYFVQRSKIAGILSPVMEVTWYGAVEYCNWLSIQHGLLPVYTVFPDSVVANWEAKGYRLPTEAEWEYAARSGGRNDQRYSGTNFWDEIDEYAYTAKNSPDIIQPVGQLKANLLGIFDMSGNVFEWCWDWYIEGQITGNPYFPTGPSKAASNGRKVNRGGSYNYGPFYARTTNRNNNSPEFSYDYIGFRICRTR